MNNTLAERLLAARLEKGWSKAELLRRSGVRSASTLTELERGQAFASPQLPSIAAALGVEVLWLQHGTGPKHRTERAAPAPDDTPDPLHAALATLPEEEAAAWVARIIAAAAEYRAEQARQRRQRETPHPPAKDRRAG